MAKEGKNSGPDEPSGMKSNPVYTGSGFHRFHCICMTALSGFEFQELTIYGLTL